MNAPFEVDDDCIEAAGSLSTGESPFEINAELAPDDYLGIHVLRLINLNPGLIKFRLRDLAQMNDQTKRYLIADFNRVLGIEIIER